MERLTILVGRPYKSVAPIPQVGRFMPLIGGISRLVESPLYPILHSNIGMPLEVLYGAALRAHSTERRNETNSVADQDKFVAGSRRHIDADEWQ